MESIYQIPPRFSDDIEQRNFWLGVIADQKTSGLSIKKFCEQHKINFSTFTYWKYKKNKSNSSLNNNTSEAKNKQLGKDVPKFIPLQIAADIPSTESHQKGTIDTQNRKIEIVFNNGHKIILPLVISDTNLLLLIRAVGEL